MNLDELIDQSLKELGNIPSESYCGILVSKKWYCVKSFQWMCENARFVFTYDIGEGEELMLVTKDDIEGMDCFEIGNDRYGVIDGGCCKFNETLGNQIKDSSRDVVPFIKAYMIRSNALDLIIEK